MARNFKIGNLDKPLADYTVDDLVAAREAVHSGAHGLLVDVPDASELDRLVQEVHATGGSTVGDLGDLKVVGWERVFKLQYAEKVGVMDRLAKLFGRGPDLSKARQHEPTAPQPDPEREE